MFEPGAKQIISLTVAFVVFLIGGYGLTLVIGYRAVALVYLAAVISLSLLAQPVPVALFAVASATVLNFFLIPPHFTFSILLVEDTILFAVYFFAAFVTSALVAGVRARERLLRQNERKAAFIAEALQELATCRSIEEAATRSAKIASTHFSRTVSVYARAKDGTLPEKPTATVGLDSDTWSAGTATLRTLVQRLRSTPPPGHFSLDELEVIPAVIGDTCLGAIALMRLPALADTDVELLASLGRALALSIDRDQAEQAARVAALAMESERLSRVLLDTVSHELRTPLTAITGALSALSEESLVDDGHTRSALVLDALASADRLNAIVDDLLSASRIGSGMLRLRKTLVDPVEIAQAARHAAAIEMGDRELRTRITEETDAVYVDFSLVSRLTANLLKNAGRYSRAGTPVELRLSTSDGMFQIEVADAGPGLPQASIYPPFRKFCRESRAGTTGGLGLGLSICEGIASAHGGRLEILVNRPEAFCIAALIPQPPKDAADESAGHRR